MLEDKQIDELERLIVFSELKDLPMILSRAVPLLFSELRLVKATLDSKVNHFLGGLDAVAHGTEVPHGKSEEGLRSGSHDMGPDNLLPAVVQGGNSGGGGRHPAEEAGNQGGGVKRGRGRPKGSRNKSQLEPRGSEIEMGGGQPGQQGTIGAGGIEASPRLMAINQMRREA